MRKTLVILSILFLINDSKSQSSSSFDGPKNAVYAELLGNGLIMSFNYDTRLAGKLGGRVGLGYVGGKGSSILTVPVLANYLLGKNGRYFEIGAGITYLSAATDLFDDESNSGSTVLGAFSLMYRNQPVDGGFMWKIGFAPVIAEGVFVPYWVGVGLGYAF